MQIVKAGTLYFALVFGARCGIWVRALDSGPVDQKLSRYTRPSVGEGLLPVARGACHHAASRFEKMRSRQRLCQPQLPAN